MNIKIPLLWSSGLSSLSSYSAYVWLCSMPCILNDGGGCRHRSSPHSCHRVHFYPYRHACQCCLKWSSESRIYTSWTETLARWRVASRLDWAWFCSQEDEGVLRQSSDNYLSPIRSPPTFLTPLRSYCTDGEGNLCMSRRHRAERRCFWNQGHDLD